MKPGDKVMVNCTCKENSGCSYTGTGVYLRKLDAKSDKEYSSYLEKGLVLIAVNLPNNEFGIFEENELTPILDNNTSKMRDEGWQLIEADVWVSKDEKTFRVFLQDGNIGEFKI